MVRLTTDPVREATFAHRPGGTTRYWVVAFDALGQECQPWSPVWHGHPYDGFFRGDWHQ